MKSNLFTFERHGRKHGPFSDLEIVRLVHNGFIAPDALITSTSGSQLRADTVTPHPSTSDGAPPLPHSSRQLSWDPWAIAWLGLVFSPFWSGAMAALNARRLGMDLPIWRPMVVALVGFTLDILLALLGMSSYLVSVALFVGAAWLIWHFDLKLQVEAHRQRASASQDHWHWFFPLLAGGPLGTLVFLAFVVAPMLPPTPEYVQVNNLGVEQLQRGEYEQAIESFDRVIQLNPDLAVAHFNRGVALGWMGDFAAARDSFSDSLALAPDQADVLCYRGLSLNELEEYDAAIRDFDVSLQLSPDNAEALNGRGVAYLRTQEYKRALADFTEALRLEPDLQHASDNKLAAEQALSAIRNSSSPRPPVVSTPSFPLPDFKNRNKSPPLDSAKNRNQIPPAAYVWGARGLYHLLVAGGVGKALLPVLAAIGAGMLAFRKKLFGKQVEA